MRDADRLQVVLRAMDRASEQLRVTVKMVLYRFGPAVAAPHVPDDVQ